MSVVVVDIGCWESPLLYNVIFMNYMRCHDFLFFARIERRWSAGMQKMVHRFVFSGLFL